MLLKLIIFGLLFWWVRRKLLALFSDGNSSVRTARMRFLRGLSGMLAKVAKADGHVSREEIRVIEHFFSHCGLTRSERIFCQNVFRKAKDDGIPLSAYASEFASSATPDTRLFLYELLWDVAAADGTLHPAEDSMLIAAAMALGLDRRAYEYCKRLHTGRRSENFSGYNQRPSSSPTDLSSAYALLGCSASDSDDTLKSAYRRQAMKYHPDHLRQNGVPESLIAKSTEKMAEINNAWDKIKRARGIS